MAATDVVSSLQREVELVKEGLKSVDENIKKLTGRDPSDAREPIGNRRASLKRNFGERTTGPAQKRFNAGSAYSRLGPPPLSGANREPRYQQLESDGESEDDDDKKPTLQSSVVATPAPLRLKQETITNADTKTQTRNKRMFGVLLGTLQKFKESSNKEAAREKRRQEIEKKLEETAMKEREEASRQKKELFFARKEKQRKLEDLEKKIEAAEDLQDWEEHDRKLTKFIRTKTKPYIFYLPAKHTDHTLDLLEKTAKHLKGEMAKRREELEEVVEKRDAKLKDVVERKKNGDRWETQEDDQDTVGKQELGDNRKREDEGNGTRKVEEARAEECEEEVNDEKVNDEKMNDEKMNDEKVNDEKVCQVKEDIERRGEIDENEEVKVDERKEESEVKHEIHEETHGGDEVTQEDDQEGQEVRQTNNEAMQVYLDPGDGE